MHKEREREEKMVKSIALSLSFLQLLSLASIQHNQAVLFSALQPSSSTLHHLYLLPTVV